MTQYTPDTELLCGLNSMKCALGRMIESGEISEFDKSKLQDLVMFLNTVFVCDYNDFEPKNNQQLFWSDFFVTFSKAFTDFVKKHFDSNENIEKHYHDMRERAYRLQQVVEGNVLPFGEFEIVTHLLDAFIEPIEQNLPRKI